MSDSFRRIFLLSHMRAYSSLFGHILGSHPDINGYYEMHLGYRTTADLARQLAQYREQDLLKPDSQFLFDKILHNQYPLNLELAELQDAIILVSLRHPQASIQSIVTLFAQKPGDHAYATPVGATDYYCQRLNHLAEFCQQHARRYYYFDAGNLVEQPQPTLDRISQWLQLAITLKTDYQTFARTGQARAGDSSEAIHRGQIISSKQPAAERQLDDTVHQQADEQYQAARTVIRQHAIDAI